jgi:hypothetical protein
VVRRRVLSRNLVNEETLAHWGLSRQKQTFHNKAPFVTLRCASHMFRLLHGHPQARNTIVTHSVRNVHLWNQKYLLDEKHVKAETSRRYIVK